MESKQAAASQPARPCVELSAAQVNQTTEHLLSLRVHGLLSFEVGTSLVLSAVSARMKQELLPVFVGWKISPAICSQEPFPESSQLALLTTRSAYSAVGMFLRGYINAVIQSSKPPLEVHHCFTHSETDAQRG